MNSLRQVLNRIDRLTPIPPIAGQLVALAEDPTIALSEIADLITHDPAITANLLKTCNSAYFGLSRKVDSVRDAIALVGLDHVVHLALLGSVAQNFETGSEGYGLGECELWRHAVSSAYIAKRLAVRCGAAKSRHLVFTAALLKDIGKLILGRFVAFSLEQINILVNAKGYSFNDAEKKIIGMNHEELGAMVAEKWCFSEKLIFIIGNHHLADESARQDQATALVYLADIICMMMGICTGADGLAYRFYSDVLKRLTLSERDLQGIIAATAENQQRIDHLVDMF